MEFKIIDKIITWSLIIAMIITTIYVVPILRDEKKACDECNIKILCRNNMLPKSSCIGTDIEKNITFNLTSLAT